MLVAGVKKPLASVCVICGSEKQGGGSEDSDKPWEGCGHGSLELVEGEG